MRKVSLVTSKTEPLTCTVIGSLAISNEIATCDGQSYITCTQPPFAQAFPFNLGARFRPQAEACVGVLLPYNTRFGVNGTFASGTPAVIGQVLWLDLDETDIYFGYSPDSNSYFQGHIKTLIVDPGACGRGLTGDGP